MRTSGNVILALDTSTRTVGLALYDGVQVLSEAVWTSNDYHTVELAPAIAEAFQKTGLDAGALGALAVALGPGSFTGLRVGLALAKGLAMARKLPMVGIPTLDILAASQPLAHRAEPVQLAAVLRAGRGRLAVGWYQEKDELWQPAQPVEVLTLNDLIKKIQAPTFISGELSEDERQGLQRSAPQAILATPAASVRRPAYLAELAWKRWKTGQIDAPAGLAPIYLHYNDPIPV